MMNVNGGAAIKNTLIYVTNLHALLVNVRRNGRQTREIVMKMWNRRYEAE